MKRCFFVLSMVCVLLIAACKQDADVLHTDTAFLKGTWESEDNGNFTFTIAEDLSFECEIYNPTMFVTDIAKISGDLDASASGLGPDDYILRNLELTGDPAMYPGNLLTPVIVGVPTMKNISITLTPNEDFDKFTFTSTTPLAESFFGNDGDFVKILP